MRVHAPFVIVKPDAKEWKRMYRGSSANRAKDNFKYLLVSFWELKIGERRAMYSQGIPEQDLKTAGA